VYLQDLAYPSPPSPTKAAEALREIRQNCVDGLEVLDGTFDMKPHNLPSMFPIYSRLVTTYY
jgi:hypothetical protein